MPLVAGRNSSDDIEWSSPPAASGLLSNLTLKYSELDFCTKEKMLLRHSCFLATGLALNLHTAWLLDKRGEVSPWFQMPLMAKLPSLTATNELLPC
jgi:hypothetical protein